MADNIDNPWRPIADAPFQEVLEVRNPVLEHPLLATRGYSTGRGVSGDLNLFTSKFTPDPDRVFDTPAGLLVCPTEWRYPTRKEDEA